MIDSNGTSTELSELKKKIAQLVMAIEASAEPDTPQVQAAL